jgi:RNA polymerase sigma-70 factor (ECF subfamily)
MRPVTDAEMIRDAQQGNTAAYDVLVRRYQTAAFRTAWLILGDPDDARDVTQSGFLKAWLGIGTVDPSRPFQPWLLTIVANEARNRHRSRRRWLARVLPEDRVELLAETGPSLEQAVSDRDEAATVLRELARLEETDRMTLWCRHVLDLSEQETAAVMACAVGTVKSRTHRALQRLRARLGEAGMPAREGGSDA